MVSRQEIEAVVKATQMQGKTLSVYINTNPGSFGEQYRVPESYLNSIDHELNGKVSQEERRDLQDNLKVIRGLVHGTGETSKSVVAISNAKSGFQWVRGLQIHVNNKAFWEEGASFIPLLNLMDEYERHVLVIADRVKARMFMIYMNEIEELEAIENPDHKDVQRTQASGSDHLRSQMQHQRMADTHALWHFKRIVELLSKNGARLTFDRLVLAGPKPSVAELEKLLPKALKDKLAGSLPLSIYAGQQEVLAAAIKFGEELERRKEQKTVNDLITMAYKQDRAVLGIEAVGTAAQYGQIERLVYTSGIERKLEEISSTVLTTAGKLEQVKGPAAEILDREGGVGAYLKFKI